MRCRPAAVTGSRTSAASGTGVLLRAGMVVGSAVVATGRSPGKEVAVSTAAAPGFMSCGANTCAVAAPAVMTSKAPAIKRGFLEFIVVPDSLVLFGRNGLK